MPTNFELKRLKPKLDIVEKPENRVHKLTDSNGAPVVRFWDISRMGSFGGGAPNCRRPSGVQGPQAPAGVKGAEPLCFVIADLSF